MTLAPHQLWETFEFVAKTRSNDVALVADGQEVTYGVLRRDAWQCARTLGADGHQPFQLIADGVADTVIGILAGWAAARAPMLAAHGSRFPIFGVKRGRPAGYQSTVAQADVSDGSLSLVLPTSGTTGSPKLVLHSSEGLLRSLLGTVSIQADLLKQPLPDIGATAEQVLVQVQARACSGGQLVLLSAMPVSTIAGITLLMRTLLLGDCLVARRLMSTRHFIDDLERWLPSSASLAPFHVQQILKSSSVLPSCSLISLGVGGGSVSATLLKQIEQRLGAVVFQGYGTTELGGPVASGRYTDSSETRWETVGRPVPGVDIRFGTVPTVDGSSGDVWCRSPGRAIRYLNSDLPMSDGFYNTQDTGYRTPAGDIVIEGRTSDFILRGGKNINPVQIESVVGLIPGVRAAIAVGAPSAVPFEEDVVVHLELEPGCSVNAAIVKAVCRDNLDVSNVPRRVVIHPELPRARDGGPMRAALRDLA